MGIKKKLTQFLAIVLSLGLSACDISAESIEINNRTATKGLPEAPVTLIVYSDFQCPACRHGENVVEEILEKYGQNIYLVFRHFPLSGHRHAFSAAVAVECAREQDKFWPYHDRLFEQQSLWGNNELSISLEDPNNTFSQYAKDLNLDLNAFNHCLAQSAVRDFVNDSKREGERLRVTSTPTFFLNNKRVVGGRSLKANYEKIIQEALRD